MMILQSVRQDEVDETNVAEVIWHLVDKRRLIPAMGARVNHVALAQPPEIFGRKVGKHPRIARILKI